MFLIHFSLASILSRTQLRSSHHATIAFQLIKCYNYTSFKNKLHSAKMRCLIRFYDVLICKRRMVGSGEVKYKDNHYDYINIDAVSLLTILVSAPCTFSLYRGNIFHPSTDLRFQFPHDYIANEIESIII